LSAVAAEAAIACALDLLEEGLSGAPH
jgi:hypothetical protein